MLIILRKESQQNDCHGITYCLISYHTLQSVYIYIKSMIYSDNFELNVIKEEALLVKNL
jgi:hypothetical protein